MHYWARTGAHKWWNTEQTLGSEGTPALSISSTGTVAIGGLSVGMVLMGTTTFSAASAVTFDACFSTLYDYYKVFIDITAASGTNADLTLALRLSGTGTVALDATEYQTQYSTSITSAELSGSGLVGRVATAYGGLSAISLEVIRPQQAAPTIVLGKSYYVNSSGQPNRMESVTYKYNTTAYFGFALTPSTGTITGTARVYAYRNV
jgi:hypothetical protein